ncbi:BrnA antitoxin family protein [Chromatium okenii]|uniref:BrnA antitoxin family protein n=1 Tax=Chromatium okenii TaxID=61644 RepID=UPI0026EE6616|nr:BrnA antitoxin family protein [Chromatium okenii]
MASVDHKPVFSPAQIAAALAAAPHRVDDPECPYDPNTPDAVAIHWANAMTSQSLPELQEKLARRRGAQKQPTKIPTTIRVDADILAAFKATGKGWQTRVNHVLREWLNAQ